MWEFIAGFPYVKSMIMGKLEREDPYTMMINE